MVGAPLEGEIRDVRVGATAVTRLRDGQPGAVDPVPVSEEDDDVCVIDVALRIEGDRRVGPEIRSVPFRRRKRQVDASPGKSAVEREIPAHREAENLIRSGREVRRVRRVDRDERLALRPALVRDIHVRADRERGGPAGARVGAILQQELVLVPPRRIFADRVRAGGLEDADGDHQKRRNDFRVHGNLLGPRAG